MNNANGDAKGDGYRRIEVLTRPGRRRRWSDDDKARIVAEIAQPYEVVTEVALRWYGQPAAGDGLALAGSHGADYSHAST